MIKTKIAWLVINISIILYFGDKYNQGDTGSIFLFLYIMIFLTFPTGIAVPAFMYILYFIGVGHHINEPEIYLYDIYLPGVFFMLAGYLQWFKLLPIIKNMYIKKTGKKPRKKYKPKGY